MTAPLTTNGDARSRREGSDGAVRAAGRALVYHFCAAMRSLKLYPAQNPIVQKAVQDLRATAALLATEEGTMELRIAGEFIFVNQTRLRLDLDNYQLVAYLIAQFRAIGTGLLRASPDASVEEWSTLLRALNDPTGANSTVRHHALRQRLGAAGIVTFEVEPPVRAEESGAGAEPSTDLAKGAYARSVAAAAEVMRAIAQGQSPPLRSLKRTVQLVVDRILTDEMSMLGLTTIREYEDQTFTHAVNVCIFAVALGRRLGLTRPQLYDLGLAALFHDCGKARIAPEVLEKRGALTADEWRTITGHTWLGMLTLFQVREKGEYPYHAMLVAYEHHLKPEGGGYPRRMRARPVGLYSKIVSVIEIFDAATTNFGYRTPVRRPAEYLAEMRRTADSFLDATCVRVFVDMLGMYPVGTVLLLDTFEIAISRGVNPDPDLADRPLVYLISDAHGNLFHPGVPADLGETDDDGRFVRSVVETLDADHYGIRVGDYFIG